MKKLFNLIKDNDLAAVKAVIEKDNNLVNCVAKQPPKKDDGQSPLQIALKNGRLDIAEYLINMGADVNFIESESCANQWRAPVIHDAISCAIMCSRFNTVNNGKVEVLNSKARFDKAFEILNKMVILGAKVNAEDSYGNTCLKRACLQAVQILPGFNFSTKEVLNDRKLTKELNMDLVKVFDLLKQNGCKADKELLSAYDKHPVCKFLI